MLTQEQLTMMAENVARIRENMAAAAREAGRDPADILPALRCLPHIRDFSSSRL